MDPWGFALENFDPIGRWRVMDAEAKEPIDASGVLVDGTKFSGPAEFRQILLARSLDQLLGSLHRMQRAAGALAPDAARHLREGALMAVELADRIRAIDDNLRRAAKLR